MALRLSKIIGFVRAFLGDRGGQIAVTFALSSVALVTAVGIGLDTSNAFVVRQELSHAALLTCQYSVRPSIVSTSYNGSSGQANYIASVNSSATTFLNAENFKLTQNTASPFTYTPGGAAAVTLSTSMPTMFVGMFGVNTIPLGVSVNCANGEIVATETQAPMVIQESFETPACSGTCWNAFAPDGSIRIPSTTTTGFPKTVGYTGSTGNQWVITGYCLEIDSATVTVPTAADGTHVAELDCDNGQSGAAHAGNSAISNKAYYAAGTYELRYNFEARIGYPNYSPTYICGSTATDTAWANDTNSGLGTALRTNQINVYFDADNNGSPGLHTTLDGQSSLAGTNLIDECVYSSGWIERSVKINVTTAGYYWTSFAADGQNDSYGGALDNIRLCRTSCSGSVGDNFPSAWTSGKALFEDTFDSPPYTADFSNWINKSGNLNNSTGTSGTSASGWPSASATGWATAPFNQINYILQGAYQGSQYVSMDGYNSNGNALRNRATSRSFNLDPGYYKITYDYMSDVDLSQGGYVGNLCAYAPSSGYIVSPPSSYATSNGYIRFYQSTTANILTNLVGVFMANGQLISTPIGGGALNSTTSYNNPNGTVSTTPTVAPDNVNYASYDSTQVNPLIDWCNYTSNFNWLARTTYVKITKPGQYWLTFSANGGAADGNGGAIDDVKLTSLNSLYGSAPPFSVVIPTPSAAPGSTITYPGFSITADPLTP